MKNIHILPTNKPSRFHTWINNKGLKATLYEQPQLEVPNTAKNIYITSEEEIKEGWEGYAFKIDVKGKVFKHFYTTNEWYKDAKKIILTTDQDLIEDNVQAINDEFLEWFVQNPSCEEVEVKKEYNCPVMNKTYDEPYISYKIIIPKEEPKYCGAFYGCEKYKHKGKLLSKEEVMAGRSSAYEFIDFDKKETLEEAAIEYSKMYFSENKKAELGFIAGAKWQQERSYSEEEVIELFKKYKEEFNIYRNMQILNAQFENWFEQFKKK